MELIKDSMFWLCGFIHVQSLISKKGEARETGRTLANDATAKQRDKYKAVKFCGEDARTILRKGAKGKLGDAYDFISLVETPVRTPFTRRLYTLLHEMDEVGRTLEPSPTEIDKYCHHCKEFFRVVAMCNSSLHIGAYYLHVVCVHGPSLIRRHGSLGKYMNSNVEAHHKLMNRFMDHTPGGGAGGT